MGSILSLVMFGVHLGQINRYFSVFDSDPRPIKIFVVSERPAFSSVFMYAPVAGG